MLTLRAAHSTIILAAVFVFTLLGCQNNGIESPTGVDEQSLTQNSTGVLSKDDDRRSRRSALSFDGIDDYVRVPDHPSLDMTDGFTVAARVYLETYVEWASVVAKGGLPNGAGNELNYSIQQSGPDGGVFASKFGLLRFTGCFTLPTPPSLPESKSIISLKKWHFIAVTFNGTTMRFYLDGELDGKRTISGPLCTNNEPLYIGVDFPGGDEYWHGLIDEVRIWNKPLEEDDIDDAMRGRKDSSPLASALVGYWRFDEGLGEVARDRSRYENNGYLKGSPKWVRLKDDDDDRDDDDKRGRDRDE